VISRLEAAKEFIFAWVLKSRAAAMPVAPIQLTVETGFSDAFS
jgi:hypothetical protein